MYLNQLISLIFLTISLSLNVKAEFKGQDSVNSMHEWQHDFNMYLLNHGNSNLRSYGVSYLAYEDDVKIAEKSKKLLLS